MHPFKRSYGQITTELIRLGINHIDKTDFLYAFKNARVQALSEHNIKSGFTVTGLVLLNPDQVLSKIQIRPYTSPEPTATNQEQWQPETPHNLAPLEQQVATIKGYLKRRSKSPLPLQIRPRINSLRAARSRYMASFYLLQRMRNYGLQTRGRSEKEAKEIPYQSINYIKYCEGFKAYSVTSDTSDCSRSWC